MKQAFEYLVTLQVQRLLQEAGLQARYLGTESRYDIAITTAHGEMLGVGEITRDCHEAHEAYITRMSQAGNSLPLPVGWGCWALTLDRHRQIRRLREEIPGIIETARSLGREELSPDGDWPQLPVHSRMRELGILDLTQVAGEGDRCLFVSPFYGGLIDGRSELLNEYVEDALSRPQVAKRLVKLGEAPAGTRELVLIPGRPEDHYSMAFRMNGWSQWPGTPIDGPTLPEDLTGVWIVEPEVGHVVAWRANTGWWYGPPQGGGWWREFQDSPELQVLFREVGE